eukprot:4849916-Prymnesium_polylepis.1
MELARVQGGWAAPGEGSAQTRYDRHDLADVLRIPGAIVSSWAAREAGFDFDAVTPLPLAGPALPPIERTVLQVPTAARNIRQPQPFVRRPHTAAASARAGRRTAPPRRLRLSLARGLLLRRLGPRSRHVPWRLSRSLYYRVTLRHRTGISLLPA